VRASIRASRAPRVSSLPVDERAWEFEIAQPSPRPASGGWVSRSRWRGSVRSRPSRTDGMATLVQSGTEQITGQFAQLAKHYSVRVWARRGGRSARASWRPQ
jgi:hypothetical protein